MTNVVKYGVYLDILLRGSIYVINKSTFLRGNPISDQKHLQERRPVMRRQALPMLPHKGSIGMF